MTSRYWDEATGGVVHVVHPSHSDEPSRSSGYDSDDSEASGGSMTTIGSDEAGGEHIGQCTRPVYLLTML
jgi:hypothetical protein